MILSAHALLQHTHTPSREDIVEAISGNICRCTGYGQIVEAVQFAADRLQKSNVPTTHARPGHPGAGHDAPEERILEATEADAPTEIVR
jgi:carbon-monoxide dehydrogenase small subunit